MKRIILHIVIIVIGVLVILGIPFMKTDFFVSLVDGEDAVTSASVILDKPSGEYVILINKGMHDETLDEWTAFFEGDDYSYIFEDVTCYVAASDTGAKELAESYQSQLPQNQMSVKSLDATLLFSKADEGKFDIIIASKEIADRFEMETAFSDETETVEVTQ